MARLPELEAIKQRQGKKPEQARASMTDAEATVMKMEDGSFRPAYNPQRASDADSLAIVGVDVVTVDSDQAQMMSMVDPHQAKPSDHATVAVWRERMGTDETKSIYKLRVVTAKYVNAQSRHRGLTQFKVGGLPKVKSVMLIFAVPKKLFKALHDLSALG